MYDNNTFENYIIKIKKFLLREYTKKNMPASNFFYNKNILASIITRIFLFKYVSLKVPQVKYCVNY